MVWPPREDHNARNVNASLREAMARQSTYPAFAAGAASTDRIEGATAFAEKPAPHWQGR